MEEKILTGKKHGMAALLGIIVLFMLALAGIIFGAVMIENDENPVLFISGMALVVLAVMLQRQQASAIIDARKMIVDGAVGMVEMALERLNENHTVELDEERKAAMVSNLLVVLCGNRDAQPVVNSGSLY